MPADGHPMDALHSAVAALGMFYPCKTVSDPAKNWDASMRLIAAIPKADPAKLAEPPTFQTPMFADRGEGFLFMGLHTAMHMGQLSIIRRMLGYPPVS